MTPLKKLSDDDLIALYSKSLRGDNGDLTLVIESEVTRRDSATLDNKEWEAVSKYIDEIKPGTRPVMVGTLWDEETAKP